MSRPTPNQADEEFLSRLVSEAGDPKVEPRPEHVADLRALIHDRLGPPLANRWFKRRWIVVFALVVLGLVAVLAWPRGDGMDPIPGSSGQQSADEIAPRSPQNPVGVAAWRNTRRSLDVSEMPAFSWPLPESSPFSLVTSIPPDLLE